MLVRERPRLTHTVEIETPDGRRYRWAHDEPDPANVFGGLSHSSTMPGGFESADCVLPRKPASDYADVERFSTMRVRDAGGGIVWEGRLEGAARTSGDQMAIRPSAVGYQALLDDDKSARGIFVGRDLSAWQAMSRERRVTLAPSARVTDPQTLADESSGLPAMALTLRLEGDVYPIAESYYDAGGGNKLGAIYYDFVALNTSAADPNWLLQFGFAAQDNLNTAAGDSSADLHSAVTGAGYFTPAVARRFAWVQFIYGTNLVSSPGVDRTVMLRNLAVYGDHGLTRRGPDPGGLYASDMAAYAVRTWAPLLNLTEGEYGTVQPSTFVIPHMEFREPTTCGEMIRQFTRFRLEDWAVWENRTFWMNDRGGRGRAWRARVGAAQLEETGPQADRVWESVIVAYRDTDGSTRTVGPPGSGADTEDAALHDSDPDNPANQLGLRRRDMLQMGTATAASATEIGRRFLQEAKLVDSSGRARLIGHVEDDAGNLHPYSHVRAGDTLTFPDSSDPSPRRIVKADHNHDERSCSVDLDAPPEGLQALLERLAVVLVPLGVN